ncbi:MAG TPA: capsid cement protein [Candidatus Angelobacter sp.]|nr:capsid cement protein [Candidatus Angelobacter sp.]
MSNKTRFGVVGPNISRPYGTDVANPALAAGIAVVGGAAYNTVALPGGANVRALGVTALPTKNAGDPVTVVELGEVTAIADAAIARGQWVMVNAATGQLAPVGAVGGTNYEAVGFALEAAPGQGDEFLLFVIPQRVQG